MQNEVSDRDNSRRKQTKSSHQEHNWGRMNTFKYLRATLADIGDLDAEMTHRINQDGKTGRGYRGFCASEE